MYKVFRLPFCVGVFCLGFWVLTGTVNADSLRSAYLGPSVWEEGLSSDEVNDQLKNHFEEVLDRLQARNATSLLTALIRAEASSVKPWSKNQRRTALIYLARNRQRQIKRLQTYMLRGRFPLNEGHSTDAVPIFVDRQNTLCAVGHLMHAAQWDNEVVQIASKNNLVRISNVQSGSLVRWIQTSGLTQEEAAMIQPGYPVNNLTSFEQFQGPSPLVLQNDVGFEISDASIRGARFTADLPTSFATDPTAIDVVFGLGLSELETNNVVESAFRSSRGINFGEVGNDGSGSYSQYGFESFSLNNSSAVPVYFGPDDAQFSGLVGGANASGNVGIIEIEYQLRALQGFDLSRFAITSSGVVDAVDRPLSFVTNTSEQNAAFLISEIYGGDSDDLLGRLQVSTVGDTQLASQLTNFAGSETTSLSENSLRIRTYGIVTGDGFIHRIYNEIETTAVPEPSAGVVAIMIGFATVSRRRRKT